MDVVKFSVLWYIFGLTSSKAVARSTLVAHLRLCKFCGGTQGKIEVLWLRFALQGSIAGDLRRGRVNKIKVQAVSYRFMCSPGHAIVCAAFPNESLFTYGRSESYAGTLVRRCGTSGTADYSNKFD